VAAEQCPSVGQGIRDVRGVPISAILFGGRRARLTPLVYEARDWTHGVYVGATVVSETTAAATGAVGVPRNDPMAMLPFCGYNMADYFAHWLNMGRRLTRPPRIFHVNWFRTDGDGRFLWPGFGDNIRVLDWILRRVDGLKQATETPIGHVPTHDTMDLSNIDVSPQRFEALTAVDVGAWLGEADRNGAFLESFGQRLPDALRSEHRMLIQRLRARCN
jgi:phosphoenolpyruvate carboxykinase (GTP)